MRLTWIFLSSASISATLEFSQEVTLASLLAALRHTEISDPWRLQIKRHCRISMGGRERTSPVLGFGLLALLPGFDQGRPLRGHDPGENRV